ncbi:MAG: hypothetical protein LBJ14_07095, partial [Desulfarculales bacterium]|nr:hypothetical protein [Desulfarculales bacterium]
MHDARLSLSLDYEKLSRFAEMLKTPFRKALRSSQVDLLPAPEEGKEQASSLCRRAGAERKAVFEGQTLIVPLLGSGRVIALIEARGVRCDQLPREVHPFLASLAETAVETVRLRWAAEIDPLSGLGNKYALRETVIAVISRRLAEERRAEKSGGREGEDLVLLGLRPAGLELLLEQHGRELEQWAWKELGRLCREAARPCLGLFRLENSLWFLLSGGKAQASRL